MPEVSVIKAAESALEETQRRLFPIQGHRWLALGFIAFLEQCGRGGGMPNVPNPGSGSPGGGGGEGTEIKDAVAHGIAYLSSHIGLVMGGVAVFLVFILAITALVLWLQSRGTFMYIDNVATGRSDIRRPWHEHAAHAGSYFLWLFGVQVAQIALLLLLVVPVVWGIVSLLRHGASAGPLIAILVAGFLIFLNAFAALLFFVLLRDFVAPLQWYAGVSCGEALRLFRGILTAHPGTFVGYVLLKIVYAIVVGIAAVMVSCILCCGLLTCCGLLPTLQIVMQPVFYFERRWSLELLHQLGYGPPGSAPEPAR
jgi:hypothetical protein